MFFSTLKFSAVLCTVLISICHAHLHRPTNLTAKWIDALTLNVSWSWKTPKSLPSDCTIRYKMKLNNKTLTLTSQTHFLENLFTESAAKWVATVQAVGHPQDISSSSCKDWKSSEAKVDIEPPKPRAVLNDFKCYLSESDMDCSWISDPSSPVSISYRECGKTQALLKQFKKCNGTYSSGQRSFCHLTGNFIQKNLCIVATTPNGVSTFIAPKAVKLPNMTISEEGTKLVLTLAQLEGRTPCSFYNICYSVCDKPMTCRENSRIEEPFKILYEKSCQYTFRYRAQTKVHCTELNSDWSESIVYGSTDWTLTVVAIVIPAILSACVILSCICFRRHKDIICPDVPDPSTIFKEMINGSREFKPNVSMYTPVQEPIEPIVIVPHIPHSSGLVPT